MDIHVHPPPILASRHYSDVGVGLKTAVNKEASLSPPPPASAHVQRGLTLAFTSPTSSASSTSSSQQQHMQHATRSPTTGTTVPSSSLARRMSSPAVLGLAEEQPRESPMLKHRNSIEAAMLLATFHLPQPVTSNASSPGPYAGKPSLEDVVLATRRRERRYSDAARSWETMPSEFVEQASLLRELKRKPYVLPIKSATPPTSGVSSPRSMSIHHVTTHGSSIGSATSTSSTSSGIATPQGYNPPFPPMPSHHPHAMEIHPQPSSMANYPPFVYPPPNHTQQPPFTSPPSSAPSTPYAMHDPHGRPPPPPPPPGYYPYPYYYTPNGHPDAKSPLPGDPNAPLHQHGMAGERQLLFPRPTGYAPHPHAHPHQQLHPLDPSFHTLGTMPRTAPIQPAIGVKRRRKEQDDEDSVVVMPGDPDFPSMSERDVEAAVNDPEARPRRQKVRYSGDLYTPKWVRFNGQQKEGLCDTCKPGKWLQLKNSAYWYHKQFFHGISSVSGKEFIQPVETRWVDQEIVEGLCHQCHHWVSVSNVKRKNSVLWFRHAHKCHLYHKPKGGDPKRK
ncbi:hypothetical protein BC940DRAFT_304279 [Gongronella butleri]|nr:hypothetical protein BC940DRAFT_304279 [Gongronella butleri]